MTWKIIYPFYREYHKQEIAKTLALLSLLGVSCTKIVFDRFRGDNALVLYIDRELSDKEAKMLHIKVWDYVEEEYIVM